jgi:hypothetical protein
MNEFFVEVLQSAPTLLVGVLFQEKTGLSFPAETCFPTINCWENGVIDFSMFSRGDCDDPHPSRLPPHLKVFPYASGDGLINVVLL